MTEIEHSTALMLVDAYFGGEIDAVDVTRMRAHLQGCDTCRETYDRRADSEAQLLGGAEAGRIADVRLLEAVLADPEIRARRGAERRWWPLFVLAPVAAVAGALLFTVAIPPPAEDDNLRSRGGVSVPGAVGLGVTAVDPSSGLVYDARRPEGVALDHNLRFSYSNPAGPARYLFLFGVDDAHAPYWYYPLPEEGRSVEIEAGPQVLARVLPYETELVRRHHGGRLRLVALFTPQPISLRSVEAALSAASAQGIPLQEIRWPEAAQVQIEEILLVAGTAP